MDWQWFEDILTYGNAKIPEALLRAYQVTQNEEYLEVALESLDFLTKEQWNGVYFELIGNEGWYPRGGERALFGQQPIDAGYLVEAYVAASEVTDDYKYLELARLAFEWFLGRNRLNTALYDFATARWPTGSTPMASAPIRGPNPWYATFLPSSVFPSSRLKEFRLPNENLPFAPAIDCMLMPAPQRLPKLVPAYLSRHRLQVAHRVRAP